MPNDIEAPKADLCSPYEWGQMVTKFNAVYPYEGYTVDFIRDIQRNAWMAGVHAAMDTLEKVMKKDTDGHDGYVDYALLRADLFKLKMPKVLK